MKLYQDRELFGALPSTGLHQRAFLKLVLKHAEHLFPEFHVVVGVSLPTSAGGSVEPSFILIDRDYQSWWLASVAVTAQRLVDSVYPEMLALKGATVTSHLADELAAKNSNLDLASTDHLVHNPPPRLFCLANAFNKEWKKALNKIPALLGVAEIFRSHTVRNRRVPRDEILRINGEQPEPEGVLVSACEFPAPNVLKVITPLVLGRHANQVRMLYRSQVTEWTRIDTGEGVMLQPDGGFALDESRTGYEIRRRSDGNIEIRARARGTS